MGSHTPADAFASPARYLRFSPMKVPQQLGTFQPVRHYLAV